MSVLNALIASAAIASSAQFAAGMTAYRKGEYKTAAAYFSEAVRKVDAGNATAHYYLADSLVRTNRISQALQEYRVCLSLSPSGEMESYCLQALRTYGRNAGSASSSSSRSTSTPLEAGVSEPNIDVSRLPRLTTSSPIFLPSLAEVNSWSFLERAQFYDQALQAVQQASVQLDEARSNLKKADSILHSSIPASRDFGESDAHFTARAVAARNKVSSLLQPYEVEIDRRAAVLQQARQILDLAIQAKHSVIPGFRH